MKSDNDLLVSGWLAQIEASQSTKKMYTLVIKKYSEFTEKTPTELIEEAEGEILQGILMRKRKIRQYLLGYQEYLKDSGKAPKTIQSSMSAVRSFYRVHDIDLPNIKRKTANPLEKNGSRARLSIEDIRKLINYAKSLRDKAIILTIVSSGLGSNEVRSLRIRHLQNVDDDGICTLELTRSKVNCEFTTFLSFEAMDAINEYLKYRNTKPKLVIKDNDDYVFVNESGQMMGQSAFVEVFNSIGTAAGFKKDYGVFNLARAHNIRKYFNSQLINNGADIFFTDYLMGHKIDETREAYFKADPEKLKTRYIRFLPYLTVEETRIKIVESSEYKKLKEENELIKNQMDQIKSLLIGIMEKENRGNNLTGPMMEEIHDSSSDMLKSMFGIGDDEYQKRKDESFKLIHGMDRNEWEMEKKKISESILNEG